MVNGGSRSGVTLVEVMLAGAVLLVVMLSLFEGVLVCARLTKENSELLAARHYAFDVAWNRMNERAENLLKYKYTNAAPLVETISSNAAPVLYRAGSPARSYTIITNVPGKQGVMIAVNVEWGPAGKRKILCRRSNVNAEGFGTLLEFYRAPDLDRGSD